MLPYETNKPIGVILFDVNGEPVDFSGGGGGDVTVTNFPASYPLPDDQLLTLTPPPAITGFATELKQNDIITELQSIAGEDFATQTTLAAILAKIIASPSTEAKQDSMIALLTSIDGKDFATQTTLAAILAKLIAAPATEAKQDSAITQLTNLNAKDFATQTTLAAILAKLIAAPSTEAKQDDTITAINSDPALTAAAPGSAVVGVASGSVLAANVNRKGLIITNISEGAISLAFGNTAVLYSGITLAPYGGTYSMARFDKSTATVFAIAELADSRISIQEYS